MEYRAPSWSWAAIDGKLGYQQFEVPEGVVFGPQVMRCHVTLKDPELPFGEVTGGSLVLRAKLIPCKVCEVSDRRYGAQMLEPPPPRGQSSGGLHHFDEYTTIAKDEPWFLAGEGDFSIDHLPDLLFKRKSEWLLPVWWKVDGEDERVRSPPEIWASVSGLILTLASPESGSETHNSKVYRRIGTFILGPRSWARLRHFYALEDEEEVEIV